MAKKISHKYSFEITEDTQIPGTNILLEKGDKVHYSEAIDSVKVVFEVIPVDHELLVQRGVQDTYRMSSDDFKNYFGSEIPTSRNKFHPEWFNFFSPSPSTCRVKMLKIGMLVELYFDYADQDQINSMVEQAERELEEYGSNCVAYLEPEEEDEDDYRVSLAFNLV